MKKLLPILFVAVFVLLVACSGKTAYHKTSMPEPKSFNAHFGDMDTSGDDLVNYDEFKAHFSHAEPNVFKAIDLNKDNSLDHDEWHKFKEAHGLKEDH